MYIGPYLTYFAERLHRRSSNVQITLGNLIRKIDLKIFFILKETFVRKNDVKDIG